MSYRLAIFDFDGTLADSFDWFIGALNHSAQTFGFRGVAKHEIETLRGLDNRALMRHFGLPLWKLPRVATHLRRLQAETIDSIRLFPGISDCLHEAAEAGMRLAIVSSNSQANIARVLGPDLERLIDHYGCGAALFGKARQFKAVLKAAGVAPSQAIAVGDEVRDIQAARKAGLHAGSVAWGYAHFHLLQAHRPDRAFATVTELRDCLLGRPS